MTEEEERQVAVKKRRRVRVRVRKAAEEEVVADGDAMKSSENKREIAALDDEVQTNILHPGSNRSQTCVF